MVIYLISTRAYYYFNKNNCSGLKLINNNMSTQCVLGSLGCQSVSFKTCQYPWYGAEIYH